MKRILEQETDEFGRYREIVEAAKASIEAGDASALEKALGEPTPQTKRFVRHITSEENARIARERIAEAEKQKDSQQFIDMLRKNRRKRRQATLWRIAGSAAAVLAAAGIFLFQQSEKTPAANDNYTQPTLFTEKMPETLPEGLQVVQTIPASPLPFETPAQKTEEDICWQTLVVPHGHTYTIMLSDSSRVTLNADSKLYYPDCFEKAKREVHISGEGYFQVSKSERPFIVQTSYGKIQVYGTSFNVYQRDSSFETVLVKGAIGATIPPFEEIRIVPGLRLTYESGNDRPQVEPIDTIGYPGWMSGMFYYDDMPVKRLLADLSAWYDISFEYPSALGEEKISLKLDKNSKDIRKVLDFIETVLNKSIVPLAERRFVITGKDHQP